MLLAISDLHLAYTENRAFVEGLVPTNSDDWLLVAGDVAEKLVDFDWAMATLSKRFAQVVWAPGNHELWSIANDELKLPGLLRYQYLVELCRAYGVLTPEDAFPIYRTGSGQPIRIAPIFTLYDYSFKQAVDYTPEQAVERASRAGIMSTDEFFLKTYPYKQVTDWCHARLDYTQRRLSQLSGKAPLLLINHYPLVREPTRWLRNAEFAIWCGTQQTAGWLTAYPVRLVLYGHLHMPSVFHLNGVTHVEASLGYPREWQKRSNPPALFALDPWLQSNPASFSVG